MLFTASSRCTHVYVEPVEPQVLVTAQGAQIAPGANAVHKVLETWIGAQRVEGRPQEEKRSKDPPFLRSLHGSEANMERQLKRARNIGGSRIANPTKNRFQQVLAYSAVLEVNQTQHPPAAPYVCAVGSLTRSTGEKVRLWRTRDGVD